MREDRVKILDHQAIHFVPWKVRKDDVFRTVMAMAQLSQTMWSNDWAGLVSNLLRAPVKQLMQIRYNPTVCRSSPYGKGTPVRNWGCSCHPKVRNKIVIRNELWVVEQDMHYLGKKYIDTLTDRGRLSLKTRSKITQSQKFHAIFSLFSCPSGHSFWSAWGVVLK